MDRLEDILFDDILMYIVGREGREERREERREVGKECFVKIFGGDGDIAVERFEGVDE